MGGKHEMGELREKIGGEFGLGTLGQGVGLLEGIPFLCGGGRGEEGFCKISDSQNKPGIKGVYSWIN